MRFAQHHHSRRFRLGFMVVMHRAPSGAPASSCPGLPTCAWPPPSFGSEVGWLLYLRHEEFYLCSNQHPIRRSQTRHPPTNHLIPKKLNEAAERALDYYLKPAAQIMATANESERMFLANPAYNTESLLANACESLGSATVMLSDFAALLEGTHRKNPAGHCASGHAG